MLKTPKCVPLLSVLLVLSVIPADGQSLAAEESSLDVSVMHGIYQWDGSVAWRFFPLASVSSYPAFAIIPLGVTLEGATRGAYDGAIELGSAMVLTYALTKGVKHVTSRPRPYVKFADIDPRSHHHQHRIGISKDAFPSGQVAMASAIATSLSLQHDSIGIRAASGSWVAVVSVSRIWMGEHYPTDVVGGLAVGASSAILSHVLMSKLDLSLVHGRYGPGMEIRLSL